MSKPIAASGYKDIFATPLGKGVEYGGTIIRRNIEDSLIPYICNTTILNRLPNVQNSSSSANLPKSAHGVRMR